MADGRVQRVSVLDLPALPPTAQSPNLQGGVPIREIPGLEGQALALTRLDSSGVGLALGSRTGIVKRVKPELLARDSWDLITLADGDVLVGAVELATGDEELAFVTSDAQLLHFSASVVRPQGRAGGGVAGIKLAPGARAVSFGAVSDIASAHVVTIAGSGEALPGTQNGAVKVSPLSIYPPKGRATGGVRCHRLLKGEDTLLLAWVGDGAPMACATSGSPVDLPAPSDRRDGSGTPAAQPILAVSGPAAELPGVTGDAEDQPTTMQD
jgi:DNA gyrase subunit A